MEPVITKIDHICIVTRDIKALLKRYEEVYGLTGFFLVDGEKGLDPTKKAQNLTTRGVKTDYNFSLSSGMIGDIRIEIVQPLDDKSDYALFLKEKGEGIHHVGVQVDTERMREIMQERGVGELATGTVRGNIDFVYYDTTPEIGMNIEVCYPQEP